MAAKKKKAQKAKKAEKAKTGKKKTAAQKQKQSLAMKRAWAKRKKAKKKMGRPKGSKNVKKKAKKKAGRPKAAKLSASSETRTVTIPASLANKIEGLTLLGKGDSIEKAIDKLIK